MCPSARAWAPPINPQAGIRERSVIDDHLGATIGNYLADWRLSRTLRSPIDWSQTRRGLSRLSAVGRANAGIHGPTGNCHPTDQWPTTDCCEATNRPLWRRQFGLSNVSKWPGRRPSRTLPSPIDASRLRSYTTGRLRAANFSPSPSPLSRALL
jgi:hypothetical protein